MGLRPYWKILNFLGKLVGFSFVTVGLIILVGALIKIIWSSQSTTVDTFIVGGSGLIVAVLGFLLILARPSGGVSDKGGP